MKCVYCDSELTAADIAQIPLRGRVCTSCAARERRLRIQFVPSMDISKFEKWVRENLINKTG